MGLQFREALGLFWHDRYKALAEAIINLVVSLILVRRFGVAGIIGGTIISSLLTCVWFEPYVLMRYGIEENWQKKLRRYFMDYIVRWVVVAGVSAVSYWIFQLMPQTNFFWFIAQGLIYTAIFAVVVLVVYGQNAGIPVPAGNDRPQAQEETARRDVSRLGIAKRVNGGDFVPFHSPLGFPNQHAEAV